MPYSPPTSLLSACSSAVVSTEAAIAKPFQGGNAAFIDEPIAFLPLSTAPALTFKERTRRFLHLLSYGSGISSIYARLQPESVATILIYHSIPTAQEALWMDPSNCISAENFEQQMHFLSQYREVISIESLTQKIECNEPIRRGTVAITFDDGYRNNFTVAAPILAKYNLPATIYLATDYINKEQNQWVDTLYAAFRTCSHYNLDLSDRDRFELGCWNLRDEAQRQQAYRKISHHLIEADVISRQQLLAEIDRQLAPIAYAPRLTLNWEEIRQSQQQYPNLAWGVHTAHHLDLSIHSDQAAHEMALSMEHMLAATGIRPQHFSFPYNRYNAQSQGAVKAAKLSSAVAIAEDPVVRTSTSPYALPRLCAPTSLLLLKSWTNGGFPDISRRLFGRTWTTPS